MGRVVRPHGLKGRVVVELWTNRSERVEPGSVLVRQGGELRVIGSSRLADSGGFQRWSVSFDSVNDRDGAESLRGTVLSAQPLDEPDALWVDQLIGAEVFDSDDRLLGVVLAVESNPASDLLVIDRGYLVPLRFVTESSAGRVVVEIPAGLLDP